MFKAAGPISSDTEVLGIDLKEKFVKINKGKFYFEHLISSLPLDYMIHKTSGLPENIRSMAESKLKRLSILVYNLVVDGKHELEGTAIYFPEKKYIFRRVSPW